MENETSLTIPEAAQTPAAIHDVVEQMTPVRQIENTLSSFLTKSFELAIDEDTYIKKLQAEILTRLPDLKPSELIALLTSATTNKNDMFSKLISPTAQILTAAQQNELANKQKEQLQQISQTNIREINNVAPSDVLAGLQSLFNLAQAVKKDDQD
jgi:hypothetical protein